MPWTPGEWWTVVHNWAAEHLWQLPVAVLILAAAFAAVRISRGLIARLFRVTRIEPQKRKTLQTLLASAARYVIYAVALLMVLATLGVEIGPLLAGLGIAGLALGFGAQSLVKDVITGFFIIFENQLAVGDYVEINGTIRGTVEEVGLRMTALREWSGSKFYLANSEIKTIRNYNRDELRAVVTATFPFSEDPAHVREVVTEACRRVAEAYRDHLLTDRMGNPVEEPQIYGLTSLDTGGRGVQITVTAKTKPGSLWTVERALREAIWEKCREHGVGMA